MKVRSKLILLAVLVIASNIGMLGYLQISSFMSIPKPTEATVYSHHIHNLTYLEELNDAKVNMSDPLLITAIREKFLRPPPPRSEPYKLKDPELKITSMELPEAIADMLYFRSNGFFVEARAFDGETGSNTLLLERRLNWKGLLVEPDPKNVAQVVKKNRKVWVSHSCLSTQTYPQVISLRQDFNTTNICKFPACFVDVQCLPLYSLLLALNRTAVDYLGLNVHGNELSVLKTIPFNLVNIKALSVDWLYDQQDKNMLLAHMQDQGYDLYGTAVDPDYKSILFMFVKQDTVPAI